MIKIYEGNTGQGKSYMLSLHVMKLLKRNARWFKRKKTKELRRVATNMSVSNSIVQKFPNGIVYWNDLEQLTGLRECDVIFDDMATYLDSQRWSETPNSVKRWLRLHEHYGCDIYGNAQDFLTIDPSVRRLTSTLHRVTKVFGSRRPSATKPRVRKIWGILFIREVDKSQRDIDDTKRHYKGLFRLEFLKKDICKVFDTTQDMIAGEYPPVHAIVRECVDDFCPQFPHKIVKHV